MSNDFNQIPCGRDHDFLPAGKAKHIRVPARGVNDFRALLADPELHWREEYSACDLANAWWDADQLHHGFPLAVQKVLDATNSSSLSSSPFGNSPLGHLRPVIILPEVKTPLPGGRRCTQTDLWVLATPPIAAFAHLGLDEDPDWTEIDPSIGHARVGHRELVSIAVEGKVRESFGPVMSDWLKNASEGKKTRLQFLCHRLGLDLEMLPGEIRYQLLHRTVAALIEAERFCAKHAVMLVHSFDPGDSGFGDYQAFVKLLGGGEALVNQVVSVGERSGIQLHFAWVKDLPRSKRLPAAT